MHKSLFPIPLMLLAAPASAQTFPGSQPANIPGLEQPADDTAKPAPSKIDVDALQQQANTLQQQAAQAEAGVAGAQARNAAALAELNSKLALMRQAQQQQGR